MVRTKNPLSASSKEAVAKILQPLLSTFIDMHLRAKVAHWNIRGQGFLTIHRMFDEVVDEAYEWSDKIAERLGQLGATALGVATNVTEFSYLPAYPLGLASGEAHMDAISSSLALCSAHLSSAIVYVDEAEDYATSNLLQDMLEDVDKWLWFVDSHSANRT